MLNLSKCSLNSIAASSGTAAELCTCYDLILDKWIQLYEVRTVASDSDDQVPMLKGVYLCVFERLSGKNIELNVQSAEFEVRIDKSHEIITTCL